MSYNMNILIPMAGKGSRFTEAGYRLDKPMIPIFGKPMIQHAIESLGLSGNFIFVINKSNNEADSLKLLLRNIIPDSIIIETDQLTEGSACSCLLAKEYINNDDPLIVTNCDQILKWDVIKFKTFIESFDGDGVVVTYDSDTTNNSYVEVDDTGMAIRLAEKQVISNLSLNGIHYWTRGKDFVSSAETMITKNIRVNNEFYTALTYNELISLGKRITYFHIDKKEHWSVGNPIDLNKFIQTFGLNVYKSSDMKDGWFIGNFTPSVFKTELFEVCYKQHFKNEHWDSHFHKTALEINYLIRGTMQINGKILSSGDIFSIHQYYEATPTFLTDCDLIVVKVPSVLNDKYIT